MDALRGVLDRLRISPHDISEGRDLILKITTHKTEKLKAGGGVRGVKPEVDFYTGPGPAGAEPVFVIVDFGAVNRHFRDALPKMSHY